MPALRARPSRLAPPAWCLHSSRMVVARAIWSLVSLPLCVVFWLAWQVRRGGYTIAAASQRAIGQRNSMLSFAVLMALFGLGLVSGFVDCSPARRFDGCLDGWESLEGLIIVGFAAIVAVVAVRHVPHDRRPSFTPSAYDYARYRSEDWRLSWSAVLFGPAVCRCYLRAARLDRRPITPATAPDQLAPRV